MIIKFWSSLVCLLMALLLPAVAQSTEQCHSWLPEDKDQSGLIIGNININVKTIFDVGIKAESHLHQRLANKLHVKTRNKVVASQLLFSRGEPLKLGVLKETERLLRSRKYIKSARVKPQIICGNVVDIEVTTTDNWTLTAGANYSRSGGNDSSGFSIQEHNLLGYGKDLDLNYINNIDRSQKGISYKDSQFFDTYQYFGFGWQVKSDGEEYTFSYGLPFYEANSKKSWGIELSSDKQEVPWYSGGDVLYRRGEKKQFADAYYGWSKGEQEGRSLRFQIGWQYNKTDYFSTNTWVNLNSQTEESYPWAGFQLLENDYVEMSNFQNMGTTEDVAMGHNLEVKAGLLNPVFGSDNSYLKLSAKYSKGYKPSQKTASILSAEGNTYLGDGPKQGSQIHLKNDWYWFDDENSTWLASVELSAADNLLSGDTYLLGGDNGLRGYPTGFQSGDKSALIKIEKRHYFNWHPMHMARFGAAAFLDAGTAWGQGKSPDWVADAGVGLRISSSQSSTKKILHIDVATPLGQKQSVDDWQLLIGTKASF